MRDVKRRYAFCFRTRVEDYPIVQTPHAHRALSTYYGVLKTLDEYVHPEKQSFGLRILATQYETEISLSVQPATEPIVSEEEAKELEIQVLCGALQKVFNEIHNRVLSINQVIEGTLEEVKGRNGKDV
jgi:hypothetical protein